MATKALVDAYNAGISAVLVETTERIRLRDSAVSAIRILTERNALKPGVSRHEVPYLLVDWDAERGFTSTIATVSASGELQHKNAFTKDGLDIVKSLVTDNKFDSLTDPMLAIKAIEYLDRACELEPKAIFVLMHNIHTFLDDNPILRTVLDNKVSCVRWGSADCRRLVVFYQPTGGGNLHQDCKHLLYPIKFSLPTAAELLETVEMCCYADMDPPKFNTDDRLRRAMADRLCGLSAPTAEAVVALAMIAHRQEIDAATPLTDEIRDEMLAELDRKKAEIVQGSRALKYIPLDQLAGSEAIRGYDDLLTFVTSKAHYTEEARTLKLDPPRGIILVGMPGTGKSQCAKKIAKTLGLPLYVLDIGSLFGSLVGQSEAILRDTLKIVEAQNQCVLLLDEVDKGFAGSTGSSGDSGVSARVFGYLLSWLQDRTDRSFIIMTMNRHSGLPPELFRPGRFDAVFGVLEPDTPTRVEILKSHFGYRECDTGFTDQQWQALGAAAVLETNKVGLVGATLEQVVKDTRAAAYYKTGVPVPTYEEVLAAILNAARTDSSQMHAAQLNELRDFISSKCRKVQQAVSAPVSNPSIVPISRRRVN